MTVFHKKNSGITEAKKSFTTTQLTLNWKENPQLKEECAVGEEFPAHPETSGQQGKADV